MTQSHCIDTLDIQFKQVSLPLWQPEIQTNQAGLIVEGALPKKSLRKEQAMPVWRRNESNEEKRLRNDQSLRVPETLKFPNSCHVSLAIIFGNNVFEGSGEMIGPYHVLTCAHNIFDNITGEWADQIYACPGADGSFAPFGEIAAIKACIPFRWAQGDNEADLALIFLEESVGEQSGWASFAYWKDAEFNDVSLFVSGYPGDKEHRTLYEMKGIILHKTQSILYYNMNTYKGQSGSPIWRRGSFPTVVGVHCRGGLEGEEWNEGTRLSLEYFTWITSCMEIKQDCFTYSKSSNYLINSEFANRSNYTGQQKNGKKEGYGILIEANGNSYKGQFRDNIMHGQGTCKYFDGTVYTGLWKNGKAEGHGSMTFPDGSHYEGHFSQNIFHGQGIYTFSDGSTYIGEWKNGKKEGQGILTWPNGEHYEGQFCDGAIHGQGTLTYSDGRIYDGYWKNSKREGQGILTWPNGDHYVGQFSDNARNGQGTLTYSDGRIYDGNWKNGKKAGKGILNYPNGQPMYCDRIIYAEEWNDDEREDYGMLTYPNGKHYRGMFNDAVYR